MRSFHPAAFAATFALFGACGTGCGPDPTPSGYCGDGRCDRLQGESNYSCPRDCPPDGTGPGRPSDGGTTPAGGFCGNRLPVAQGGVLLPVRPIGQQCQEWCWAATTTMVGTYYGVNVSECGLASSKAGFSGPVCCQYAACAYPACDQAAQPDQIDVVLGQLLGIHGIETNGAIGEQDLGLELSNGRPVIVGYLNSFAGHVVLVSGFGPGPGGNAYHVIDPYYGVFDVSYGQLAYGYMGGGMQWTWAFTWSHLSPDPNGCNTSFDPSCACQ